MNGQNSVTRTPDADQDRGQRRPGPPAGAASPGPTGRRPGPSTMIDGGQAEDQRQLAAPLPEPADVDRPASRAAAPARARAPARPSAEDDDGRQPDRHAPPERRRRSGAPCARPAGRPARTAAPIAAPGRAEPDAQRRTRRTSQAEARPRRRRITRLPTLDDLSSGGPACDLRHASGLAIRPRRRARSVVGRATAHADLADRSVAVRQPVDQRRG